MYWKYDFYGECEGKEDTMIKRNVTNNGSGWALNLSSPECWQISAWCGVNALSAYEVSHFVGVVSSPFSGEQYKQITLTAPAQKQLPAPPAAAHTPYM